MFARRCVVGVTSGRARHEPATSFLPVLLSPNQSPVGNETIRLELKRGTTTVCVSWLASAAAQCAERLKNDRMQKHPESADCLAQTVLVQQKASHDDYEPGHVYAEGEGDFDEA
jgi:hypothetical protein